MFPRRSSRSPRTYLIWAAVFAGVAILDVIVGLGVGYTVVLACLAAWSLHSAWRAH